MNHEAVPRHTNRLIHETSPYLLQHAHNPVDWYPWGEEALSRAKAEDKPILLSIGYSTCHWCHVMERESFEDEAIARLMNEHFVCIKVDREERPDLDEIYMTATLALTGQGGWPMTVFLTPDQEPFFAGTYFPPMDRYGRPGFKNLLRRIAELWEEDRASLREQARHLTEYLRQNARPAPGLVVGEEELRRALLQFSQDFDPRYGGFGPPPKFPPATGLSLLLRCWRRFGDAHALEMVRKTLDAMAQGGMYDQIGGGFHRYAVDERWLVPHFEKMLYDNALLARVYLEGYQVTGEPFYRQVATEVLDYILREMTSPEGGFYSSTDADSEGEEGKFYVWTPSEIEAILGEEEAYRFCAYYDITEEGNWEGKSIPNTPRSMARVANRLGIPVEELERSIREARPKVYEARRRRIPPGLDDKILTAWNGLVIGAMAEGFRGLGDRRYLAAAERAADFLLTTLARPDGRLLRTYRAGKARLNAYLEDYAYLCEALIDLYEAGGAPRFLREAERLADLMLADFHDEEGGFYSTARDHERLIVRHREGHDGATPSPNATAAHALARLSYHLDREDLREVAIQAIQAYGKAIARAPRSFAKSLIVVDLLLEGPVELALIGTPGRGDFEALRREIGRRYLPNRIIAHHDPERGDPLPFPLLQGKGLVDGQAALYVCRNFTCQAPITDPVEGAKVLETMSRPSPPQGEKKGRGRTTIVPRLSGSATPAGTRAYADRFTQAGLTYGYGPLGSTGLTCSRLGFGGYRIDDETPEHREALTKALLSGCNLIDTSTNYTDGRSERLIGEVLNDLVRRGRLRREEVIVVSKIGYVQGQNLVLAREREARGEPFPEMVKYADGIWHCIHPEFLKDQLEGSLDRLQLETLDILLLHNPEYFLADMKKRRRGALEEIYDEFYRRLQEAFAFLEGQVQAGRIRWYGVSSNTCIAPADDPEATSLTRMLAVAREAGGPGHHFRVLQLPLNLFEAGGVLTPNNGPDLKQTVLEYAAQEGIGVLVNRPLNAIIGDRLVRLAEVVIQEAGVEFEPQLQVVADLEAEFQSQIAPYLQTARGSLPPQDLFRFGEELAPLPSSLESLEQWKELEGQVILPRLVQVIEVLDQALTGPLAERWQAWRNRYLPAVEKLLGEIHHQAALKSRRRRAEIARVIDPLLPEERRGESLSRKALWILTSTPGVSCVLNGMRKPAYVDDTLGILPWPPLQEVMPLYQALQEIKPSMGKNP